VVKSINMFFTGLEVRLGKNCARGIEYGMGRGHSFPDTVGPRPVNNVFIFSAYGGGTRRIGLRILVNSLGVLLRALSPTTKVKTIKLMRKSSWQTVGITDRLKVKQNFYLKKYIT